MSDDISESERLCRIIHREIAFAYPVPKAGYGSSISWAVSDAMSVVGALRTERDALAAELEISRMSFGGALNEIAALKTRAEQAEARLAAIQPRYDDDSLFVGCVRCLDRVDEFQYALGEVRKLEARVQVLTAQVDKMRPLLEGELIKYDWFPPEKDSIEEMLRDSIREALTAPVPAGVEGPTAAQCDEILGRTHYASPNPQPEPKP
jgi:hypothetical protein